MTLASFLPFWKTSLGGGVDVSVFGAPLADKTAWTSEFFFFPVTILPVACGVLMALHVVVSTFTSATLPRRILGLTWNQVHVVLGLQAAVMMLAFLVQERGIFQFGVGFYTDAPRGHRARQSARCCVSTSCCSAQSVFTTSAISSPAAVGFVADAARRRLAARPSSPAAVPFEPETIAPGVAHLLARAAR